MAVKLTPQLRKYAMNVASVGGRMQETGRKFGGIGKIPVKTKDDIISHKKDYLILLDEFKSQSDTLKKQDVPDLLQKEHDELLVSFERYVNATSVMIDSLDVENVKVNKDEFEKGKELQALASKEIVDISGKMAKKLGI